MSISNKDIKKLYGKAAGRCSICKKKLFESDVNLGEMAHIIARRNKGPRGNVNYDGDINGYDNLILLCLDHHTIVDQDPKSYTESDLLNYKNDHENWVDAQLNTNKFHEEDSVFLKAYLEFVPFLKLEHFINFLPNFLDSNFFDFTYMFEACCKDHPHLYPLNDGFYLEKFIDECYELECIIRDYTDDQGIRKNYFEGTDIGNRVYINKSLPYDLLQNIYEQLKRKKADVLSAYRDFIDFIRKIHPEISLRNSGQFYED